MAKKPFLNSYQRIGGGEEKEKILPQRSALELRKKLDLIPKGGQLRRPGSESWGPGGEKMGMSPSGLFTVWSDKSSYIMTKTAEKENKTLQVKDWKERNQEHSPFAICGE